MQCRAVQRFALQSCAVQCCAVQCCAVLCFTVLCSAVQCCAYIWRESGTLNLQQAIDHTQWDVIVTRSICEEMACVRGLVQLAMDDWMRRGILL